MFLVNVMNVCTETTSCYGAEKSLKKNAHGDLDEEQIPLLVGDRKWNVYKLFRYTLVDLLIFWMKAFIVAHRTSIIQLSVLIYTITDASKKKLFVFIHALRFPIMHLWTVSIYRVSQTRIRQKRFVFKFVFSYLKMKSDLPLR